MTNYVKSKEDLEIALTYFAALIGDAESSPAKTAFIELKTYYKAIHKTDFDESDIEHLKPEDITSQTLYNLLDHWEEAIDWVKLKKGDRNMWVAMQSAAGEIKKAAASLEQDASLVNTEAAKGEHLPLPVASKILEDFMNGPFIKTLIVQKASMMKRTNDTVMAYGVYDKGRNEAAVELDDEKPFNYSARSAAIGAWFASEIQNYSEFLKGANSAGGPSSTEMAVADAYLHDLLAGYIPDSSNSTERDWSEGSRCCVTFTGINLPGIALRVDPIIFTNKEIKFLAAQIEILNNLTAEFETLCSTPESIMYAKSIKVNMDQRMNAFDGIDTRFTTYDLDLVNIDRPAQDLVEQIRGVLSKDPSERPELISALFYGVPGSGKSQLANYIGAELGLPVIKKTYAELQSMYVGEGEKQLRKAFEEAQAEGAILLIDEIDSIAGNRNDADKNYQKTFVNQLLTELDNFKGIFVATSNFMSGLDPAVLRRLFLKIKFDFLSPEQVEACANLYFPKLKRSKIGDIPYLTPGDFKAVKEASLFEVNKMTIARLREMLSQEVTLKKQTLGEVIKAEKTVGYDF